MKKQQTVPTHIAIIMDGNGRWAKRRALPRFFGHEQGLAALKKAIRYAADREVKILTVYAFSTENWQRPSEEVNFLMDLMHRAFVREIAELQEERVRIVLVGDRQGLSPQLVDIWNRAETLTKDNERIVFNVAFNYGGRREIIRACQNLAKKVLEGEIAPEEIGEAEFSRQLFTWPGPDPDLIIRTGGEMRLSNFLLWQAAYSEIYVTDTLWPDFNEKDFARALEVFAKRERRFGKVSGKGKK